MKKSLLLFGVLFCIHLLCLQAYHAVNGQQDVIDHDAVGDGLLDEEIVEEDGEAEVEEEEEDEEAEVEGTELDPEEEEVGTLSAHPDTSTAILFSTGEEAELVAGKVFTSLIHFANTGSRNFIMTGISGSFRYPQDYSYYIQNFTSLPLNKMIDAGKEGSFVYEVVAAEMAAGRPFGLVLTLEYKDTEDKLYQDTVFNRTVTVKENEDGVDAETFFMYVVLAALFTLSLFGLYSVAASKKKKMKRVNASKPVALEMGTADVNIDYTWIPQNTLKNMNKGSPSPKRLPRSRGNKRVPSSDVQ